MNTQYTRTYQPTFLRFRFRDKKEYLIPWTFAENIRDISFVDIVTGEKSKNLYDFRNNEFIRNYKTFRREMFKKQEKIKPSDIDADSTVETKE